MRRAIAKIGGAFYPFHVKVRCHGARGSIPVSGREYVRHGGDTACLEILPASGPAVVVDAGSGIRRLGRRLREEGAGRVRLFLTHSHWDHILGFPFFEPLYDESFSIELRGCPSAQGNLRKLLSGTMAGPYFPVPFEAAAAGLRYEAECPVSQSLDSLTVSSIPISHPNGGLGFRFEEAGKCLVFLTDNELGHRHRGGRTFEEYAAFAEGADLLVHDAQFTPEEYEGRRGWGHSSWRDVLRLAREAKARRLGLFHHDPWRDDAAQEGLTAAASAAGAGLEVFSLTQETVVEL